MKHILTAMALLAPNIWANQLPQHDLTDTVLFYGQHIPDLSQNDVTQYQVIEKMANNLPLHHLLFTENTLQQWANDVQPMSHDKAKIEYLFDVMYPHVHTQLNTLNTWLLDLDLNDLMMQERVVNELTIPKTQAMQYEYFTTWVMSELFDQYHNLTTDQQAAFEAQLPQIKQDILTYLNVQYMTLAPDNIHHAILSGYLQSKERNSAYLNASQWESMQIQQTNHLGGIGATLNYDWLIPIEVDGDITFTSGINIIDFVPDSPAEQALLPADHILGVVAKDHLNPRSSDALIMASELQFQKIIEHIRGPIQCPRYDLSNCQVSLLILRNGHQQLITLTRDDIFIESQTIQHELIVHDNKRIGKISIPNFYQFVSDDFFNAYLALQDEHIDGLVIDVRNNPGGLLHEVIMMLGMILDNGPNNVLLSTQSNLAPPEIYDDYIQTINLFHEPIMVLINERSASASEILAGTLQEYRRALIVGAQSYGKGSVQSLISLSNDGSLGAIKTTIYSYHFPSGVSPEGIGVTPDVHLYQVKQDPQPIAIAPSFSPNTRQYPLSSEIITTLQKSLIIMMPLRKSMWFFLNQPIISKRAWINKRIPRTLRL